MTTTNSLCAAATRNASVTTRFPGVWCALLLLLQLLLAMTSTTVEARIGSYHTASTTTVTNSANANANANAMLQKQNHRHLQFDEELPMFEVVANNGRPSDAFPLGVCQGDCDNDAECEDGLVCFQRNPDDPVPGCAGIDYSLEYDYCVYPALTEVLTPNTTTTTTSSSPTTVATVSPTLAMTEEAATMAPTEDDDDMSEEATATTTFSPTEDMTEASVTISPTQAATQAATEADTEVATTTTWSPMAAMTLPATTTMMPTTMDPSTLDPTTESPTMPETTMTPNNDEEETLLVATMGPTMSAYPLSTVGNDGNFLAYPLSICEGDCDTDDDCIDELICFQRVMDEDVPGCAGAGDFSIDYCIHPDAIDNAVVSATMAPSMM